MLDTSATAVTAAAAAVATDDDDDDGRRTSPDNNMLTDNTITLIPYNRINERVNFIYRSFVYLTQFLCLYIFLLLIS